MQLSAPDEADVDALARQSIRAQDIVAECAPGRTLGTSLGDVALLQQVLDAGHLTKDQRYDLQCLGIAFGRILASNLDGLDWAIIEDEYGRDPTLRYRDTSLVFGVLTMISKRAEAGEIPDLRALFEWVGVKLVELKGEVD